ncbi:MAG: hypothetical protein ACI4CT_08480 [Lachnospiraceae bacterium]
MDADIPELTGRIILEMAYFVISNAVASVGGRYALIECRDNCKLIDFYQENGFREFDRKDNGEMILVQMIKKVCEEM